MESHLNRAQSVQRRLSSMSSRLETAESNANSRAWPYAHLDETVRIYVKNLAETVRTLVAATAAHAMLPAGNVHAPVNDFYQARIAREFRKLANERGCSVEVLADATFATCECQIRVAAQLVAHIEACVEGEQTMDGRAIARGPLHDK